MIIPLEEGLHITTKQLLSLLNLIMSYSLHAGQIILHSLDNILIGSLSALMVNLLIIPVFTNSIQALYSRMYGSSSQPEASYHQVQNVRDKTQILNRNMLHLYMSEPTDSAKRKMAIDAMNQLKINTDYITMEYNAYQNNLTTEYYYDTGYVKYTNFKPIFNISLALYSLVMLACTVANIVQGIFYHKTALFITTCNILPIYPNTTTTTANPVPTIGKNMPLGSEVNKVMTNSTNHLGVICADVMQRRNIDSDWILSQRITSYYIPICASLIFSIVHLLYRLRGFEYHILNLPAYKHPDLLITSQKADSDLEKLNKAIDITNEILLMPNKELQNPTIEPADRSTEHTQQHISGRG